MREKPQPVTVERAATATAGCRAINAAALTGAHLIDSPGCNCILQAERSSDVLMWCTTRVFNVTPEHIASARSYIPAIVSAFESSGTQGDGNTHGGAVFKIIRA